jgi:pimeloyl-ACP methyl ester carboxylesterase
MEGYAALLTRRGRGHNIVNILRGWSDDVAALRGAISRVKAPSKLVWGSKDLAVDPRSANALQASLPVSDLVLLPGVGHLPFEESPQEFNAIVLEFLGRTSE